MVCFVFYNMCKNVRNVKKINVRQWVHLCLFCETKESSEELFSPQS